jgi:hypothetical protein
MSMPVDFNAPKLGRPGVSIGEDLADQVLAKQFEIERLVGLLARLEWAGTIVFDDWYDKGKCCPVPGCRAEQGDTHDSWCWLGAELAKQ